MAHRLFAPIVLAGIALAGCQREKQAPIAAAAPPASSPVATPPRDASASRDAAAEVLASASASAEEAPQGKQPKTRAPSKKRGSHVPDRLLIL